VLITAHQLHKKVLETRTNVTDDFVSRQLVLLKLVRRLSPRGRINLPETSAFLRMSAKLRSSKKTSASSSSTTGSSLDNPYQRMIDRTNHSSIICPNVIPFANAVQYIVSIHDYRRLVAYSKIPYLLHLHQYQYLRMSPDKVACKQAPQR
jgi:hypothetical protein